MSSADQAQGPRRLDELARGRAARASGVTLALTLSGEQVELIARRVADLVGKQAAEPDLLTVPEAAEFLRCKPQRVRDLLSQGRIGRIKEGGRTLVARSDLMAHLRKAA